MSENSPRGCLLEGALRLYDAIDRLEKSESAYKAMGAVENAQILSEVIVELARQTKRLEKVWASE